MSKSTKCGTCMKKPPSEGDTLCAECRAKFDDDIVESLSALKVFTQDMSDSNFVIGVMKGLTFLRAAIESAGTENISLRNVTSLGKDAQELSVKLVKVIYGNKKASPKGRFVVLSTLLLLLGAEMQTFPCECLDELVQANGKKFDDYFKKIDEDKRRKDDEVGKSYL